LEEVAQDMVDRVVREPAGDLVAACASSVELLPFLDLADLETVDLLRRDLRQPMPGEERQQVIRERPAQVDDRF
jgi:hypothetical protein